MARLRMPPRGVIKTSTYAAMHFVVAVALSIGIVEPLVQTGAYALHERVWSGVGRDEERGEKGDPGAV